MTKNNNNDKTDTTFDITVRLNFKFGCFFVCDEATVKLPHEFESAASYHNQSKELVKVALTDHEKEMVRRFAEKYPVRK